MAVQSGSIFDYILFVGHCDVYFMLSFFGCLSVNILAIVIYF